MSSITITKAVSYLGTLREFINNDIPAAINGNANYLAALGLSAYTEHVGGLYCGDLRNGRSRRNYICFIDKFFPADYMGVNTDLEKLGGLYGVIRSGLAHEYFIKTVSKIEIDNPAGQSLTCGITYNKNSNPQIVFYVKQYFEDFNNAFEKYYDQLKNDTSGSLLKNFENALGSISSSLIGKLPKDFREDVSGKRQIM
jgi:hypothetical protein